MIADGKVIFTAPDEGSLHCLRLRDGALLWTAPRVEDVYVAGIFDGKVLLVGTSACRALNLADGKQAWRLATEVPSGRGVGGGGLYYLPLRRTRAGDPPGIVAIDVGKGRVVQTFMGKEVPGNLLFHGGYLIAQGATSITAYPLFKEKRE
jgi:hypothetical protein